MQHTAPKNNLFWLPFLVLPTAGLISAQLFGTDRPIKCILAAAAAFLGFLLSDAFIRTVLQNHKEKTTYSSSSQLEKIRRTAFWIRNRTVREELKKIRKACKIRFKKNSPTSPEQQRILIAQTLPALLRLTRTYRDLERHPLRGMKMEQTMRQIETELTQLRKICEQDCDNDHLLTLLDTSAELSSLKKAQKEN